MLDDVAAVRVEVQTRNLLAELDPTMVGRTILPKIAAGRVPTAIRPA